MELTQTSSFGVVAERFRRAGQPEKAITLCREGLEKFPDHLSARVTLGWSLLDMGEFQEAFDQLKTVLKRAPDNLAAIRGLAELHERGIGLVFDSLSDPEPEEELDPVMPPMLQAAEAPMEFDPVVAAPVADDLDPVVEAEVPLFAAPAAVASRFEIEDVIDADEPDSMFDLSGLLNADEPERHVLARTPASAFGRVPLALRDDDSVSQYMAS